MESKRLNMHYWVVWKKEEEERSKELIEERERVWVIDLISI